MKLLSSSSLHLNSRLGHVNFPYTTFSNCLMQSCSQIPISRYGKNNAFGHSSSYGKFALVTLDGTKRSHELLTIRSLKTSGGRKKCYCATISVLRLVASVK